MVKNRARGNRFIFQAFKIIKYIFSLTAICFSKNNHFSIFTKDENKISGRWWKHVCTWCSVLKVSISRNFTFCVVTRYNVPLVTCSCHLQLQTRMLLIFDEIFANCYLLSLRLWNPWSKRSFAFLNRGRSEVFFSYAILSLRTSVKKAVPTQHGVKLFSPCDNWKTFFA